MKDENGQSHRDATHTACAPMAHGSAYAMCAPQVLIICSSVPNFNIIFQTVCWKQIENSLEFATSVPSLEKV